jgi:hypothetical protein
MIGSVTVQVADRIVHVRTKNIGFSLSSCFSFYPIFAHPPPFLFFMNPTHVYFTLPFLKSSTYVHTGLDLVPAEDSSEAIIWQVTSLC